MDKNEEKILYIMRNLKIKREDEIKQEELDIEIIEIKYLGKIMWKDEIDDDRVEKEKDIFMIIEDRNGSMIYKYYDENMEMIAAELASEEIYPDEKYRNKEDKSYLKDISEFDKNKAKSLNELETENEKNNNEEEKTVEEKDVEEQEVKDLKISNAQGKIDLNQMVDGKTLRNLMGLDADDVYIAPVSSDSVNLKNTNAKETFVALKSDNTARVLYDDVIKEDRQEGINSADQDILLKNNGEITKRSAISNYILGNGKYSLAVYYDQNTSTRITTITKRSGRENTEGEIDKELHHQEDQKIDSDLRDSLREKNGIGESDNMRERQEAFEKAGIKNDRVENIDSKKENDIYQHIEMKEDDYVPNTEITWGQLSKSMNGKDIKELQKCFFESFDGTNEKEVLKEMNERNKKDNGTLGEDNEEMGRFREGPWDKI